MPPAFTFGTAGRTSMISPGLSKADMSLQREIFPLWCPAESQLHKLFNLAPA